MGWMHLAIAAFSLAKEIIKYVSKSETDNKIGANAVKEFGKGFKKARVEGCKEGIDHAFECIRDL